jgi:hypothetical protein
VAKDGSAFSLPFKKVKGRKEENPSREGGGNRGGRRTGKRETRTAAAHVDYDEVGQH